MGCTSITHHPFASAAAIILSRPPRQPKSRVTAPFHQNDHTYPVSRASRPCLFHNEFPTSPAPRPSARAGRPWYVLPAGALGLPTARSRRILPIDLLKSQRIHRRSLETYRRLGYGLTAGQQDARPQRGLKKGPRNLVVRDR